MNIVAHGLWGMALTPKKHFHQIKWAVFWSVFPDIFWGVAFIPWLVLQRWQIPSDWSQAPTWFYLLYGTGHSLLVWLGVSLILLILRKWTWPLLFWLLHILTDIPGHTHYQTPFLFPLSGYKVPGIFSWDNFTLNTLSHLIPLLIIISRFSLKPRK